MTRISGVLSPWYYYYFVKVDEILPSAVNTQLQPANWCLGGIDRGGTSFDVGRCQEFGGKNWHVFATFMFWLIVFVIFIGM